MRHALVCWWQAERQVIVSPGESWYVGLAQAQKHFFIVFRISQLGIPNIGSKDHTATMDTPLYELSLAEIVQRYPNKWVLVEETAWDGQDYPIAGIVRAASIARGDLREPLRLCHQHTPVKTFIFYTGEQIPANLTVVL